MTTNVDDGLRALAEAAGLAVDWTDAHGNLQTVTADTLRTVLAALNLPGDTPEQAARSLAELRDEQHTLPPLVTARANRTISIPWPEGASLAYRIALEAGGEQRGEAVRRDAHCVTLAAPATPGYHRLEIGDRTVTLAVAPTRSPQITDADDLPPGRPWAAAVQVYSLRQSKPALGGIGDFSALAAFARAAAQNGAWGVAISPVHAGFGAHPERFSPYAPSSRLFLNTLFIDPTEVFGQDRVEEAIADCGVGDALATLDAQPMIDWVAVASARRAVLRRLFDRFPSNARPQAGQDFMRFRTAGGEGLARHACYEVLAQRHLADGGKAGWQHWTEPLRDPRSRAVEAATRTHADDVRFELFLQWLADRGLAQAHAAAREAGMPIGLIADLAVGTDPSGSHAWSRQPDMLRGLSPGAPPDLFNTAGQGWGLTAFSPRTLKQTGYAAFIEMLRATLAHAGGVRIDHALGLERMWLVPEGQSPADGVYLRFPFDEMMNLISLEAWRHKAVVIGENLGTVPEGFDDRIADAGMLGMSVLWFEREDGGRFRALDRWSRHNVAMSTTHDLPTIAGWWAGKDIDWRVRLELLGDTTEADHRAERDTDKRQLWQALGESGDMPGPDAPPIDAIFGFLARTPAPLVIAPVEDLLGQIEQPNLPGTIDTHPNWRQRLAMPVEHMFDDAAVAQRVNRLQATSRTAP